MRIFLAGAPGGRQTKKHARTNRDARRESKYPPIRRQVQTGGNGVDLSDNEVRKRQAAPIRECECRDRASKRKHHEIGRASCRERVKSSAGGGSSKKY